MTESIGIGTPTFVYTNCLEMCNGPTDALDYCACNTQKSRGYWLVKDIDGNIKCQSIKISNYLKF